MVTYTIGMNWVVRKVTRAYRLQLYFNVTHTQKLNMFPHTATDMRK